MQLFEEGEAARLCLREGTGSTNRHRELLPPAVGVFVFARRISAQSKEKERPLRPGTFCEREEAL